MRTPYQGIHICVWSVDMYVTMEMVSRLEGLDQPAEGIDAAVWQIYHIVCAPRR